MDLARFIAWLEDRVIVGDPWLLQLALRGPEHAKLAQLLLRTQAGLANRLGHILDYSPEYVRRMLTRTPHPSRIPPIYVRCMRCDTRAYLNDWVALSIMDKGEIISRLRSAYLDGSEARFRFMEPCNGKQVAVRTDKTISQLLGE